MTQKKEANNLKEIHVRKYFGQLELMALQVPTFLFKYLVLQARQIQF